MKRRILFGMAFRIILPAIFSSVAFKTMGFAFGFNKPIKSPDRSASLMDLNNNIEKVTLSDAEWKERLSVDEYFILRDEGTEKPFSSELNNEKRKGKYICRGCDHELFTSEMKYDSGTGWPSFYATIEGAFEIKVDYKIIYPRKEYHCAKCGGHHGHVFNDGPPPSGKRWCNNGIALKFIPESS